MQQPEPTGEQGQWRKEYRNDGDGPMKFADGSLVCMVKDGPHSIIAYDVAEPDADRIIADHTTAALVPELLAALRGMLAAVRQHPRFNQMYESSPQLQLAMIEAHAHAESALNG